VDLIVGKTQGEAKVFFPSSEVEVEGHRKQKVTCGNSNVLGLADQALLIHKDDCFRVDGNTTRNLTVKERRIAT